MPTEFPEIFAALAARFTKDELKKRDGGKGQQLTYITARTACNRLDDVLGPENWTDDYVPFGGGVKCLLSIKLPNGQIVTKTGIGGITEMRDGSDTDKTGESDSLKRAAVKFGIARYLYRDGVPQFVRDTLDGKAPSVPRERPAEPPPPNDPQAAARASDLNWVLQQCDRLGHLDRLRALALANYQCEPGDLMDAQALALWNLIQGATVQSPRPTPPGRPAPARPGAPGRNANGNPQKVGWPHSGSALYAWCKSLEKLHRLSDAESLVKAVDQWCGGRDFPRQWKEWSLPMVEEAALYVAGLVRQMPGYTGEWEDRFPKVLDLEALRDQIWGLLTDKCRALGVDAPTHELLTRTLMDVCHGLGSLWGGEIITDLRECENQPLLQAVMDALEEDLKDSRAAY